MNEFSEVLRENKYLILGVLCAIFLAGSAIQVAQLLNKKEGVSGIEIVEETTTVEAVSTSSETSIKEDDSVNKPKDNVSEPIVTKPKQPTSVPVVEDSDVEVVHTKQTFSPKPESKTFSQSEISEILIAHNSARISLGLSALSWSNVLEKSAEEWATKLQKKDCAVIHSVSEYGENLFMEWTSRTGLSEIASPSRAVGAWTEEEAFYNYEDDSCKEGEQCGHYTQIVWADTRQVGCSKKVCNLSDRTQEIWVCQYDPAGNILGELPY